MKPSLKKTLTTALIAIAASSAANAQEKVLNLYSARHYQTDELLYSNFTKETGIKINRIEANDNALLERIKTEGRNSPADVILLADAARLWRAQIDGLFQPVNSKMLNERVPANLRGRDDGEGAQWYGFSRRARIIVYDKATVNPADIATYESLADPKHKGKICTRSGSHPYMLSMLGSLIERNGQKAAEDWARGMVANFARPPRGGDTDQIRGVAAGECAIAVSNSYYYARLMRSTKPEDQAMMSKLSFVWPNQKDGGTHVNISGAGVAKYSPNREAAVKFLEYLASDSAQAYFADGNNEWPVVKSLSLKNPALDAMGDFEAEKISVANIGMNQVAAQRIMDRVGYK